MKSLIRVFAVVGLSFFLSLFFPFQLEAQQTIAWRNDTGVSNWWDSANPWWYSSWQGQNRPDNDGRGYVIFDNNNQLTTTVNGAWFNLRTLTIQENATSGRTFNSSGSAGISVTEGFTFSTSPNHTFNVDIGIDGATVSLRANSGSANIAFNNNFYLNANTANFG